MYIYMNFINLSKKIVKSFSRFIYSFISLLSLVYFHTISKHMEWKRKIFLKKKIIIFVLKSKK